MPLTAAFFTLRSQARLRFFPALAATCIMTCIAVTICGCITPQAADLQLKLAARDKTIEQNESQLAAQRVTIEDLRTRLLKAQNLDPDRLNKIYFPVELKIASLSGGADYDGKPGDDGVTVYMQPLDRDGDVIKAAGDLRVQLFDLAAAPERQLVGEISVSADECGKLWYGKLMTQHFTVKCPWRASPPEHDEITIRATFADLLTGNVINAQTTCRVNTPR